MVNHTLIFAFPPEMSDVDRNRFFREGSALALDSGLVESYEYRHAVPLTSEVAAPDFAASAMARVRFSDLESMRKYFAHEPLREFVQRWRARFPYRVVAVNTED
jgi:hypothetical protein